MVEIKPMDKAYIHAICLHEGTVDTAQVEVPGDPLPGGHPPHPWTDETLRKLAAAYRRHGIFHPWAAEFQREMIHRYGTCAILAWEGESIVGHLRFCPMKVARILEGPEPDPCPVLRCSGACDPEEDEGTLWVLCVMTCRPYSASGSSASLNAVPNPEWGAAVVRDEAGASRLRTLEEAGARRGVGLELVQGLIAWAREHGWRRIVKIAHADLDAFYGILGGGGKTFWEKAGFHLAGTFHEPQDVPDEYQRLIEAQMSERGMSEREVWTWYRMVYDLRPG